MEGTSTAIVEQIADAEDAPLVLCLSSVSRGEGGIGIIREKNHVVKK